MGSAARGRAQGREGAAFPRKLFQELVPRARALPDAKRAVGLPGVGLGGFRLLATKRSRVRPITHGLVWLYKPKFLKPKWRADLLQTQLVQHLHFSLGGLSKSPVRATDNV